MAASFNRPPTPRRPHGSIAANCGDTASPTPPSRSSRRGSRRHRSAGPRASPNRSSKLPPMASTPLNRDAAWQLLTEYTKSDSLLKHALGVEAALRGYMRKFGERVLDWGLVVLLLFFEYQ